MTNLKFLHPDVRERESGCEAAVEACLEDAPLSLREWCAWPGPGISLTTGRAARPPPAAARWPDGWDIENNIYIVELRYLLKTAAVHSESA